MFTKYIWVFLIMENISLEALVSIYPSIAWLILSTVFQEMATMNL